jgi:hypothetical protein
VAGLRVVAITRSVSPAALMAALFVGLNLADAWLTTQLLARGGVESFWWSAHYNSNIFVKGFLALLVAVVLIRLGKAKLLKWLNIAMLIVVLSNGLCFLGYFISWSYWQTQIATYP